MKPRSIAAVFVLPALVSPLFADGAFYGDPPDATHPWAIHDMNRPQPPRVEPGTFSTQQQPGTPPSDATILFDGTSASLSRWEADKNPPETTQWVARDGALQCVPGSGMIRTKEQFGDCQLHVEWASPTRIEGNSQGRGNSGVFLMGEVEVQVLNNYDNPTYSDGFAGSVYGVNPPMANALRKPGEWQYYDIVFRRPVYEGDQLVDPGYLTVFCNGVLLQDHTPLEGGGGHRTRSHDRPFPETGPLKLQDHGNPVRFRNIWIRPLPKRAIEGGDTSVMSPEATTAKRHEIAAGIRDQAADLKGKDKLLHLLESLCYEQDAAAEKEAAKMVGAFASNLKRTPDDKLESMKGDVLQVNGALQYLAHFDIAKFDETDDIQKLVKDREWDK
ncbi:3-keto-disaccharide hydrolase [Haloferula sargassicola]|uniref:3-keto-alpha-glucoside-1,2-lyase/3-keto-2-hydroxy-glucal hydratase domain-containing protein n=1 Tax=Haloferula sargassicola TaxID=490096 RepID=A0ABP9UJ57_9BACT